MNKRDAAKLCGVTAATLDGWYKSGVPWFPRDAITIGKNGYITSVDGEAIKAAMEARDAAQRTSSDSGGTLQKLKTAKLAQEIKLLQIEVENAERERDLQRGNILPRDEYTRFVREVMGIARDRWATIPKSLAKLVDSDALQSRLLRESTTIVEAVLSSLARSLEEGPAD